jgi:acyl dehydratase
MGQRDLYFDDFKVGDQFHSRGVTVTEAQIVEFGLLYDPQPLHIDIEAAKESIYGGLIASGFQTLALSFRMLYQIGFLTAASLGGPGLDELRWLKPVRPGDTLRVRGEVKEAKASKSKPDRGVIRMAVTAVNQRDEPVLTATFIMFAKKRAPASP